MSVRLLDGRYQVIQIIEFGHWGHTYLAQDTRRPSQAECVIQHVIPVKRDPAYQSALRQIFVREAATLERLGSHEQIPQLLACFENEQGFHLVQEAISGTALSAELESQPWREDRVVQILLDCLEVLAVVHQDCGRHGDIRPDNLIQRSHDGALILTNFGSARDLHLSLMTLQRQPASSMVPNTQGYQPAEQIQGLPCSCQRYLRGGYDWHPGTHWYDTLTTEPRCADRRGLLATVWANPRVNAASWTGGCTQSYGAC